MYTKCLRARPDELKCGSWQALHVLSIACGPVKHICELTQQSSMCGLNPERVRSCVQASSGDATILFGNVGEKS